MSWLAEGHYFPEKAIDISLYGRSSTEIDQPTQFLASHSKDLWLFLDCT